MSEEDANVSCPDEDKAPAGTVRKHFEDILAEEGRLIYGNVGTSMLPLIREGRDLMIIEAKGARRPKRGDAVLYKRGERYVLHRIIAVRRDGYVLCGDNQRTREPGVRDGQILGILTGIVRGGREISLRSVKMKVYAHAMCDLFPVKAAILRLRDHVRAHNRKKLK